MNRYSITRSFAFDAGHRVPLHASKCRTPHGHRYTVELTVSASSLSSEGFVIDFGVVKDVVGRWIDNNWDHTMIYQIGDTLMEEMRKAALTCDPSTRAWFALDSAPTAENLAKFLFRKCAHLLKEHHVKVDKVRIFETPNCWADWSD